MTNSKEDVELNLNSEEAPMVELTEQKSKKEETEIA